MPARPVAHTNMRFVLDARTPCRAYEFAVRVRCPHALSRIRIWRTPCRAYEYGARPVAHAYTRFVLDAPRWYQMRFHNIRACPPTHAHRPPSLPASLPAHPRPTLHMHARTPCRAYEYASVQGIRAAQRDTLRQHAPAQAIPRVHSTERDSTNMPESRGRLALGECRAVPP